MAAHLTLPGGALLPRIGFGTAKLAGAPLQHALTQALKLGYRHIDTAQLYANEAEIGTTCATSGIPRAQLFLTTKLDLPHMAEPALSRSIEASLTNLKTDYLDLLLVHWPRADLPLEATFEPLRQLQAQGLVKNIGVSNFPVAWMRRVVEDLGLPLAVNQVEYHLNLSQAAVHAYAQAHGIALVAYCPLGRGRALAWPEVQHIAEKHGKTPAQIALRWLVQQPGVAAIPQSTNPANLATNLDVFGFNLTPEDLALLAALPKTEREFKRQSPGVEWDAA